jgi:hypothetical protein
MPTAGMNQRHFNNGVLAKEIRDGIPITDNLGKTPAQLAADARAARKDPVAIPKAATATQGGAGTELKKLLSKLGLKPAANCKCNQHIAEMNQMGIAWCTANIDTIVGWLREEADRIKLQQQTATAELKRLRSLPADQRPADECLAALELNSKARVVPFTSIGARILVKRAISNARKLAKV